MTLAVKGIGTTVKVEDTPASGTFTTIAEVTSLSGPNTSAEEIEVTNLDSTAKEFIAGIKESGTVDLEVNWIKETLQARMRDDVDSGTKRNYEIEWQTESAPGVPDVTKAAFSALPLSFAINTDPGSAVGASISLRIDGDITWT